MEATLEGAAVKSALYQLEDQYLRQDNLVGQQYAYELQLREYQSRLTEVSTQATLVLGFAIAAFIDSILEIASEESTFCMWASGGHVVMSAFFLLIDITCLCYCLLVVLGCSFLAAKTEDTLLFASPQAAVFRMGEQIRQIYKWFANASALVGLDPTTSWFCCLVAACLTRSRARSQSSPLSCRRC